MRGKDVCDWKFVEARGMSPRALEQVRRQQHLRVATSWGKPFPGGPQQRLRREEAPRLAFSVFLKSIFRCVAAVERLREAGAFPERTTSGEREGLSLLLQGRRSACSEKSSGHLAQEALDCIPLDGEERCCGERGPVRRGSVEPKTGPPAERKTVGEMHCAGVVREEDHATLGAAR